MPAGFLGFRPTTTSGSGGNAPGVWNLREVFDQRRADNWPSKYVTPVAANAPTNLAATAGNTEVALSWTAPTDFGTSPLNQYSVEYNAGSSINPFSSTNVNTGSTSTSHTITGLTNGQQYAFRVKALTGTGLLLMNGAQSSVVTATPAVPGITPNTDTKARFYLHSTATSVEITAETTTNYYKITHNGNSIIAREHPHHTYPTYYWNTTTGGGGTYTIINRPRFTSVNTSAVVVVESCDINGNASGSLRAIDISKSANKIKGVDISGCTSLHTLNAGATGGPSTKIKPYNTQSGSRAMASLIDEVRAVSIGTALGGQTNQYYSPTWTNNVYVYTGGFDFYNQQLDATALNQLYTDIANSGHTGASALMVGENPGTGSDNPSLATGVTVYGS